MRFRCVSTAVLCLLSFVSVFAAAPQPAAADDRTHLERLPVATAVAF